MPKVNSKKELSSEKLAQMVQRGLVAVQEQINDIRETMATKIATKTDLHDIRHALGESEERLLDAIRNTEVKRGEFETLQDDVKDLSRRVNVLDKKR